MVLRPKFIEGTIRKEFLFALLIAWTSLAVPQLAGANEVQRTSAESGASFAMFDSSGHGGFGYAMAQDTLDLEAPGGYTNEYVFGMTKAVMRSTLAPAVKPMALIFTIPLDLATLPFAVVGGLFR
jgi:hypothetical protein